MSSKMKKSENIFIFIFISIFLIWSDGVFSLRITELSISATLECDYDLEGESLYSVKWYKDRREFYRYNPNENPAASIFELPGIQVNLEKSTDKIVSLESFNTQIAGVYTCEVSADSPLFNVVTDQKKLKFV